MSQDASNILAKDADVGSELKAAGTLAFDDVAIVRQVRCGDMEAFGLIVAKYQDRIYNVLLRICGRAADAEELAQEAFLRSLEQLDKFQGKSRFYTWLFRIAVNLALSQKRRGARVRFQSLSSGGEYDGFPAGNVTAAMVGRRELNPPDAAMAVEAKERVLAAVDDLNDEYRIVVILRDFEDMSYAQIAEVLGVPVGTVKSRICRARALLRDKLAGMMD